MKKTIVILATASALVAGMASCKKEKMPKEAITETVNVSLKTNESYQFVLPKNLRDDPYEITTQAKHAFISEVGTNTNGDRVFKYTPITDYTGTDMVVISNDQEREEHQAHPAGTPPVGPPPNEHHKHDCKGGEEDHYIYTFNFITENATADPATKTTNGIKQSITVLNK